nr:MAG TPA: hypothetical protein [Caudoviricetes sp.]
MITCSFTESDLIKEINKDMENILKISDSKDQRVTRIILKSSVFPVYIHSFVTTKLKNKWLILWEARSKKNIGENSMITLICFHDTPNGRFVYMPSFILGKLLLIAYPPHFFSRYAERMNISLSGMELVKYFFERNASYGFTHKNELVSETTAIENVYGSCSDGIALGVSSASGLIVLFKTFITYEMLKGEQVEDFAKTEVIRKEFHEKDISIYNNPY